MEEELRDSFETKETTDPDYVSVPVGKNQKRASLSLQQQDAKEHTVQKIERIIHQQFALEIHLKGKEVEMIDNRIDQAKAMLDRLRACILARYYGTSQRLLASGGALDSESSAIRSWSKIRRSRRECQDTRIITFPSSALCRIEAKQVGERSVSGSSTSAGNSVSTCTVSVRTSADICAINSNRELTPELNKSKGYRKSAADLNTTSREQLFSLNESAESVIGLSTSMKKPSVADQDLNLEPQLSSITTQSVAMTNTQTSNNTGVTTNSCAMQCLPISSSTAEEHRTVLTPTTTGSRSVGGLEHKTNTPKNVVHVSGSRFYVKKRIIIGNTSKYIPLEKREEKDKSTHKWMIYVRGLPDDLQIYLYVKKVWFFLHPSYQPNDIVEVSKPPFHLTRRGWGEFPIRVQLHFVDSRNKRVDIIHELKLDKTYTGLQTLGAETVVDLEIDRKTFEDLGLSVPIDQTDQTICQKRPEKTSSISSNAYIQVANQYEGDQKGSDKSQGEVSSSRTENAKSSSLVAGFESVVLALPTLKQQLELQVSSAASTPFNSLPDSRCASPAPEFKNSMSMEIEQHLHKGALSFPLIHPQRDVARFPFCARNVEQFLSWNPYKRRAAEWQRAGSIKKYVQNCVESCDLSTKVIMIWCRRYGYTPCVSIMQDSSQSYCKVCGKGIEQNGSEETEDDNHLDQHRKCLELTESSNTYTTSDELLSVLENMEKVLSEASQKEDEEDMDVDIVSVPNPKKSSVLAVQQKATLMFLPLTPEQQWIKDVCNDVGVGLRPMDIQGVDVHAVESVLLTATKRFMGDLMRTALAISTGPLSTLEPKVLVPSHIHQALSALPFCDFLTNSYIGYVVKEGSNCGAEL